MTAQNFTTNFQGYTISLPTGNAFYILVAVVAVGTLGCLALILAAVIGVAYLLLLALDAGRELVTHMALVYSQSDSIFKLIIWLVVLYFLIKVLPYVGRSIHTSFARMAGVR